MLCIANYMSVIVGQADLVLILKGEEKLVFKIAFFCTIFFILMLSINLIFSSLIGILVSVLAFTFTKSIITLIFLYRQYKITTLPKIKIN